MESGNRVDDLIANGYSMSPGDAISRGWEIMSKNLWVFVGAILLYFVGAIVIGFIPFGNFLLTIFGGVLLAGFFLVCHKTARNENAEFGDFFGYFKDPGQLILVNVVRFLLTLIVIVPFIVFFFASIIPWQALISGDVDSIDPQSILANMGTFGLGITLMMIPLIYISIVYLFAIPLVQFKGMGFWQAMESSRKVIGKRFFSFFGLLFFLGLINILGVIIFFIGTLFTIPLGLCAIYAAYEQVIGFDEDDTGSIMDGPEGSELLDA